MPPSGALRKGVVETDERLASLHPPTRKWQEILIKGIFKESSMNTSQTVGIYKFWPLEGLVFSWPVTHGIM